MVRLRPQGSDRIGLSGVRSCDKNHDMSRVSSPLATPTPHPRFVTTSCIANDMIPDIHRTTTSPETRPLEDTASGRKPACESTRCGQSDEQNIGINPSATACNARIVGCWRMENAQKLYGENARNTLIPCDPTAKTIPRISTPASNNHSCSLLFS